VDVDSIFDVQVKRLHAYKRQLLNVLHVLHLYNRMKEDSHYRPHPRTFIFGAKAAPSYHYAKEVIKLINTIADKVNSDSEISPYIKIVFLENYRVSLAEEIFPASDISEQISTASKEASGTGNMKFMMNGAITIGTLDGANIEILERVGEENMFIFGLRAKEVNDYYQNGTYHSPEHYYNDHRIRVIVDQLLTGFSPGSSHTFEGIYDSLIIENDQYFVLKDFGAYVEAQARVAEAFKNEKEWSKKSLINIAKSGYFSSDRTIKEYADDIWNIHSIPKVSQK
jgi:starch phosphorylase